MIVSLNWLKKFTEIDMQVDELVTLIGVRLVEIEEVIDLGAKYKGIVAARIIECKALKDTDHLKVVKLDDGGKANAIERDERGLIQVVCGAPNAREGIMVAWLPPNTTVPATYGSNEPLVLTVRDIRGVTSNGMIASSRELALNDDHEGILELDNDIAPGADFADVYELNDYLFDIENKSLTHRPDTFGIIGFAREVAAIQDKTFHTPDWLQNIDGVLQADESASMTKPTVMIDDPKLSDRYMAVVLSGVDGKARSPLHIQSYLTRVGVRPMNAAVDITNYLMMLTGQPLHAFDYDKVVALTGGKADIHVRAGRADETLLLLDGRKIILTPEDIVIAAGETAIALAGAMGGADTEVDDNTKNIILESATFNLYNLRATQMRHGIFSEAITRFTKGQPAELTAPVLARAVQLLNEHAGGRPTSDIAEDYPGKREIQSISLKARRVNETLGSNFTIEDIIETLKNVEFDVSMTDDDDDQDPTADGILQAKHPYWRADIHIPEDIIEEIGRLNGFDMIEPTLPRRDFTAVRASEFDRVRTLIRQILTRAGANEVLTYSFVHGDMITRAAQKLEGSYRITNSISPQLQYYRQTLTPSLLNLIHPNIKQGYDRFSLYELNKVHPKPHDLTDEGVPGEVDMVALAVASKTPQLGTPYYQAKKILDYLGESLGLSLRYTPIDTDPNYPVTAPFEYRRSALVTDKKTDTFLGIVGEYKKSVVKGFKLPDHVAGFEIGTRALAEAVSKLTSDYTPLSRYPGTERDICFRVGLDVDYQDIIVGAQRALSETNLETSISPVDIYQPENTLAKNVTIRLRLTSYEKTLTGEEVANVVATVVASVVAHTKATVI